MTGTYGSWIRKGVAILLTIGLSLLFACGIAEESSRSFLYTFIPGTALEGEGTTFVNELLNAVQIRLTNQQGETEDLYRIDLISEGNEAFYLTAQDGEDGAFSIMCSLLGKNMLVLRLDQMTSFFRTLVQILGDLKLLRGESLQQVDALAERAGGLLTSFIEKAKSGGPDTGLNLDPYLELAKDWVSDAEETTLSPDNPECPGAVRKILYHLTEEDLNALVDLALGKLESIPVLAEELRSGRLMIGQQVITDRFIRELFRSMKGDTTLIMYENQQKKILKLTLNTPDIADLMNEPALADLLTDPEFARIRGLEILIRREETGPDTSVSITDIQVLGLDKSLMTVRLDKGPGAHLERLEAKKTHHVGEMDSEALWDTLKTMWVSIAAKGADLVLDLPRCVFDLLVDKVF